ncbi:DUF2637 domain-containing protein [Embleya hyalina]|uniref:DUF2637 domain-containing protein n=1 Tax=Embleya hyalina TaxID=516124 RepID=A0A401YR96_9ACTN|nr:DUF2637 domain-containing protein [Embleya hyalina]GCD97123.1 hypothetical protein EHYA_04811 [Embleya hyalina]
MNTAQVRSAEQALSVGTWAIVAGAMLYSVLTVTPLAAAHTPPEWAWTAPILPLVVDAAVVIVVRLDATLARLGEGGGAWPIVLRWMTGAMTLALNVAESALRKDMVGAAVHAVAPLLLIVTAETGLAYRRAITAAQVALNERERAERAERERAEVERREAAERARREEREYEARVAREQREHDAAIERERAEVAERARREERDAERARERAESAERERREREDEQRRAEHEHRERQAAERERRERLELLSADPAEGKLPEDRARLIVRAAFEEGHPVRAAAELCGWSVGWVSTRYQEFREEPPAGRLSLVEGAR